MICRTSHSGVGDDLPDRLPERYVSYVQAGTGLHFNYYHALSHCLSVSVCVCAPGITHFAQDPERVEVELVKFSLGLEEDEDIGERID